MASAISERGGDAAIDAWRVRDDRMVPEHGRKASPLSVPGLLYRPFVNDYFYSKSERTHREEDQARVTSDDRRGSERVPKTRHRTIYCV